MDVDYEANPTKCVYFLRKRPRLTTTVRFSIVASRVYRRKTPIMLMPTEVLQRILSFFTNDELARNVRLINRRFRMLAQFVLNKRFLQLKPRMDRLKIAIEETLPYINDDMEIRCFCKMIGVLEILIFYYSLLRSTIWRYIYFKKQSTNICMYGGIILDLYENVLLEFVRDPINIYSPVILKDYSLPDDVKIICSKVKEFSLHFDRVIEVGLNPDDCCTDCKVLDILDTAVNAKRVVLYQKLVGNTLTLRLKYTFNNSWFVALDISDEKQKLWSEQQRLMYMRLRRIVTSHSEMMMESEQYKREKIVRVSPKPKVRRPINSVYTGYGEVGDKFFYYGVMNEGAYINKFISEDASLNSSYEFLDDKLKTSYLGLHIYVDLRCPIQLAPYVVLEEYRRDNAEFIEEKYTMSQKRRLRGLLDLKLNFHCPSASFPRLPTTYCYYVRNKK